MFYLCKVVPANQVEVNPNMHTHDPRKKKKITKNSGPSKKLV